MPDKQERVAVVQQFGRTYRSFLAAFEAQVGLPMTRWRILLTVFNGGSVSQKFLVETLQLDPGALTRQLKSLELAGWVSRSVEVRDNRITNVTLTPAGQAVVEAGMPRRTAFLDEVLARIPEQQLSALSDGLKLLEAGIAEQRANAEALKNTFQAPR
jgi:DNA-binding MarR family transcriptional regulator